MHALTLNPDGSERLEYTVPGLPVRTGADRLSIFQDFAAACHWHDDFEILIAADGEMDYFVNGRIIHLNKGECVLVNARRLHYGFSQNKRDCGYKFVVFHPSLLGGAPPVEQALRAFSSDDSADYWRMEATSEGALLFAELFACAQSGNALQILAGCARLLDAVSTEPSSPSASEISGWPLLRNMTGFIQGHYTERISLEQIAAAGAVCRSRCCTLFRKGLNCTPIEYLTRYRLDKACAMLREGSSVTEAALFSGFHGASYFAEVFKKTYGVTPRDYHRDIQRSKALNAQSVDPK